MHCLNRTIPIIIQWLLWVSIINAQNQQILDIQSILKKHNARLSGAFQCLIVVNNDPASIKATFFLMEKTNHQWKPALSSFPVVIGRRGFAVPDQKAEGDGKSPTGVFSLGTAFGYEPAIKTKMPYQQATAEDFWVDDPNSSQYNTWVHGKPEATSFEYIRRKDDQYKYGLVIKYNMEPIVKDKGSAIFIHVWRKPDSPTAGCVAMAESDILKLLDWLDPQKNPLIIMGSLPDLLK